MPIIPNIIWNRACYGGGEAPAEGDKQLAELLQYHGYAMNGGVFHATEARSASQLRSVKAAYRYFGLDDAVAVIERSQSILKSGEDVGEYESELSIAYERVVADAKISAAFEEKYAQNPELFAPVH